MINGKQYKYLDGNLSRDLIYQKIHPLAGAAFDADCLTPFRILKIIIVGLNMGAGNAIKNCYLL